MIVDMDFFIRPDGDYTTAHVREDILDARLLRLELLMQIDILDTNSHLAGETEEDLELVIGVWQAGDAFTEVEDADQAAGGDQWDARHRPQGLHLTMDIQVSRACADGSPPQHDGGSGPPS